MALTFREFLLRREHLHPHESILQVTYYKYITTREDCPRPTHTRKHDN